MKVVVTISALRVFLSVASWAAFTITQGGDALNGKIEDGRYCLGSHSRYTEVSAAKYEFSRLTVLFVWILSWVFSDFGRRREHKTTAPDR